jgi:dihydrodipicolinate synthase/N-acetylneuraminate lyase
MKKKLSAVVISITPFDQEGKLDEVAFRRQLGRLRDAGVTVYVAGSGTSEAFTYMPEERGDSR